MQIKMGFHISFENLSAVRWMKAARHESSHVPRIEALPSFGCRDKYGHILDTHIHLYIEDVSISDSICIFCVTPTCRDAQSIKGITDVIQKQRPIVSITVCSHEHIYVYDVHFYLKMGAFMRLFVNQWRLLRGSKVKVWTALGDFFLITSAKAWLHSNRIGYFKSQCLLLKQNGAMRATQPYLTPNPVAAWTDGKPATAAVYLERPRA